MLQYIAGRASKLNSAAAAERVEIYRTPIERERTTNKRPTAVCASSGRGGE